MLLKECLVNLVKTTQIFRKAQDLYVAEDDFYKIYNFLAEV